MRTLRWRQFGLFGAVVLSLATAIKVVRAVVLGAAGQAEWGEAGRFAAAIFGMGFLCGVIVWAGRGLSRRLGMAGDAIVGLAVMLCFFLSCMLLFDPELLGAKFSFGGAPMLALAIIVGLIGGAVIGQELRKESAKHDNEQPDNEADAKSAADRAASD
jgi:hypothetical protein